MIISTLKYYNILKIILLIFIQISYQYINRKFKKYQINQKNETLENIPYFFAIINIIISLLLIMSIFNVNLNKLFILFGTGSAIILFSIQQIFRDFISGILILFVTKTYSIDDVIELKEQQLIGVVKEINLFNSVINNSENTLVHIPNSRMYDNLIYNHTKNDTTVQFFQFGINFNSDFVKIKELINKSISNISIIIPNLTFESAIPSVTIKEFEDSKAIVEIRIVVKFEDRFKSKQLIFEAINNLINEDLIEIPYPKLDLKFSPFH